VRLPAPPDHELLVGLDDEEVARRRATHGPNSLPPPARPSLGRRILRSLRDPLVLVLLASLALTVLTGDLTDAAVIAIVIVVNSTLAVRQEISADEAVSALGSLVSPSARVIRSGQHTEVPVADLVPGDLVVLREGDLVPADVVLLEGTAVRADESTLTGESVPVDKLPGHDPGPDAASDAAPSDAADHDDTLLSSGTVIVHGRGVARVVATGADSALGRIAAMIGGPARATPLQRRMARLSAVLAAAAVSLSLLVLALGLLQGQDLEVMVLTAIALIVAAVPESLPLVVTVSMALAARRMATRRALVHDLAAVETLGSVTLLATDKTGTLTRAEMTVAEDWQPPGATSVDLWRAVVLCNDAAVAGDGERVHGDPTEAALLRRAMHHVSDIARTRAASPRRSDVPFDSTTKRMLTLHDEPGGGRLVVCKGAPEALLREGLLDISSAGLAEARRAASTMAADGLRVIAVAQRLDGDGQGRDRLGPDPSPAAPPEPVDLRLLGLVALKDPLRESSRDTVQRCRRAGMRVVLVTGDHPETASAIAGEADIEAPTPATLLGRGTARTDPTQVLDRGVFARATPADKVDLVEAWQGAGEVVAMTGDGVNDAPALRRADIGVAMGSRGTEVARQAADLVLADDNLATVVAAVEEGRRVYANIRRFLLYGLSGGASEVALMLLGPAVGIALPLLPAQILWVNLLTHSFAGAGLAAQPADARAMDRPPRPPRQGVLAEGLWWRLLLLAAYLAVASLAVQLAVEPGHDQGVGQSATLLALGAGQLAVAWAARTAGSPIWRSGRIDPLVPTLALALVLLLASVLVPPLSSLLGTVPVGAEVWGLVTATAAGAYVLARLVVPRTF
jgi:Ca2+-transporting ATPase